MAKKGKPIKQSMKEFIEENPEIKDYTKGFEAYEQANLPKGSKGLFMHVWNTVYGSCRIKKSATEKSAAAAEVIREMQKEQEKYQKEASQFHIAVLLSSNEEEKKALRQKEELAVDALFAANRKIRNYLESFSANYKPLITE